MVTPEARRLVEAAVEARRRAYAPYSKFLVGAALLGRSGNVYLGCNVENAAYGTSWCAERTAIGNAVVHGEREFEAIAVVADSPEPCVPCGACRQALAEFGELVVYMANLAGEVRARALRELLPESFDRRALGRGDERERDG